MATTLTRYLKLKVADDLSADAKYNLNRLDTLGGISGATFGVDSADNLNIRTRGNITIEPASDDVGGTGTGGTITLGTDDHNNLEVIAKTASFKIDSALSLWSNTTGEAPNQIKRYLRLSPSGTLSLDRTLTVNVTDENRSLTVPDDGTVVVIKGDGLLNLAGPLAIGQGGTGAATAILGTQSLLEPSAGSYSANATKILSVNSAGTGLEWKAAGAGQVVSIQYDAPIYVDDGSSPGDIGSVSAPIISIPEADGSTGGYLSSTDWTTFNNKQDSGNFISSLTGDVTAVGPGAAITTLASTGVVPNTYSKATVTVDVKGRITAASSSPIVDADISATAAIAQSKVVNLTTDLAGKEPTITGGTTSQYWRGDKTWYSPVIDSAAGTETDQAASVSAMKSYVSGVVGGGKVAVDWLTADGATKVITHGLGTNDVTVEIYDESGATIYVDSVVRTAPGGVHTVTLTSSSAP
jgi:hypothetical protein